MCVISSSCQMKEIIYICCKNRFIKVLFFHLMSILLFLLAESRNFWSRRVVEDGIPWMKETRNIRRKQRNTSCIGRHAKK